MIPIEYIDPRTISDVTLTNRQQSIVTKIVNITSFIFSSKTLPVRVTGFLLEGSYQTGKTEILRQSIKRLKETYKDLKFSFNDAAGIAAPAFGESEKILSGIFTPPSTQNGTFHRVIILDDIDCLFFGRDVRVSQSWHISLNSVLFHELDAMDPRMTIVMATTNKPEIVDGALRSRLFKIIVPESSTDELLFVAKTLIGKLGVSSSKSKDILSLIERKMKPGFGFRDVQQTIIEYIASGEF